MTALLLLALLQGPAESEFERGIALARAGRWADARAALEAGRRKAPGDKRFPIELAGVAFRQGDRAGARARLREALKLDRGDAYANDFLATLYQLDGNLPAALKYWNRVGKPRLEEVRAAPEPRLDPVLLDRALAFSPAAVLRLRDYEVTQARLRLLDAFPRWRFELEPRAAGEAFDLTLRAAEPRWWWSLAQGLPFESVAPRWRDLGGQGVNVASLLRWDPQKRRAFVEVSAPLARDPAWRWRAFFDGRDENWAGDFKLKKTEVGAGLRSAGGWWSELAFSERHFRGASFEPGGALQVKMGLERRLVWVPERRFQVDAGASWALGRSFRAGLFTKAGAAVEARWRRGGDWETAARLSAGETAGALPFDELYMLGLERDNDLLMRAHIGTSQGRKGSAPLGRRFALFNAETYKTLYDGGWLALALGPFLDSGRAGGFGRVKWLWDTGLQARVRLPGGVSFVVSWGKDLRTGRNAWYARGGGPACGN